MRRSKRNSRIKSDLRTCEKKLRKVLEVEEKQSSSNQIELLSTYTSKMMKATQKGVVKKETAGRKISRLSSQVHRSLNP